MLRGVASSGGGGITIGTTTITGGATTQVLFNLGGVVSSSANLTFNSSTNRLNVATATAADGLIIGNLSAGVEGIWRGSVTPGQFNGIGFNVSSTVISTPGASGNVNIYGASGLGTEFSVYGDTAGKGVAVIAGTATTDVAALTLTRTNNNAAVARGVDIAFTDTSSAAGWLAFNLKAGTAGTSPILQSTKVGNLLVGSSAITAAQGTSTLSVKHATASVTAAVGATATATNLIPAKANVLGVNTIILTALGTGTGTTGYTVGDGSDADRWGVAAAVIAGTDTDGTDATADPTGWFTAANNVVLTATGGNFDGTGVIFVHVMYTISEAD